MFSFFELYVTVLRGLQIEQLDRHAHQSFLMIFNSDCCYDRHSDTSSMSTMKDLRDAAMIKPSYMEKSAILGFLHAGQTNQCLWGYLLSRTSWPRSVPYLFGDHALLVLVVDGIYPCSLTNRLPVPLLGLCRWINDNNWELRLEQQLLSL